MEKNQDVKKNDWNASERGNVNMKMKKVDKDGEEMGKKREGN